MHLIIDTIKTRYTRYLYVNQLLIVMFEIKKKSIFTYSIKQNPAGAIVFLSIPIIKFLISPAFENNLRILDSVEFKGKLPTYTVVVSSSFF